MEGLPGGVVVRFVKRAARQLRQESNEMGNRATGPDRSGLYPPEARCTPVRRSVQLTRKE